jgi:hypothetical protein
VYGHPPASSPPLGPASATLRSGSPYLGGCALYYDSEMQEIIDNDPPGQSISRNVTEIEKINTFISTGTDEVLVSARCFEIVLFFHLLEVLLFLLRVQLLEGLVGLIVEHH